MSRALIARSLALAALGGVLALRSDSRGDGPSKETKSPAESAAIHTAQVAPDVAGQTPVERALAQTAEFEFVNTPLYKVVASLGERLKIKIELKPDSLTAAGAISNALITDSFKGISVRSALHLMLDEEGLDYSAIADDTLLISSADAATQHTMIRTYDVRQFAEPPGPFVLGPASWDTLSELITSTIEPTSWDGNVAAASLHFFDSTMVVVQAENVQSKIAELLPALDAARRLDPAAIARGDVTTISLISKTSPEARIDRSLDSQLDLDFNDAPLKDIADTLGRKLRIPIRLSTKVLGEAGITQNTPLSFKVKQVRARVGLHKLLALRNMDFVIEHEVLLITTADAAKTKTVTEVYPLGDFAGESGTVDYDTIIEAITSTVSPASWGASGGPGSIAIFPQGNALVFSQTQEVHGQVKNLFAKIRASRKANPQPLARDNNAPVVRFYSTVGFGGALSGDVDQQAVDMIRKLIAPNSWTESDAYIGIVPGAIVVRQTPQVQREIQDLLGGLSIGFIINTGQSGTGISSKRASSGGGFGGLAF